MTCNREIEYGQTEKNNFLLRPRERPAGGNIEHGKGILQITIARKASHQSPIKKGQLHDDTTIQRGDSRTLWCLHKDPDTTRTRNYCTGCLQIPRLDLSCQCVHLSFEGTYGLDIFIPSPRDNHLTVEITACQGNQLVCRQKGSTVLQKKTKKLEKSLRTSSSAQDNPVHAQENSVLHAKKPIFTLWEHSIPHRWEKPQ